MGEFLTYIRRNLVEFVLYIVVMVVTFCVISFSVFLNGLVEQTTETMSDKVQLVIYVDDNVSDFRKDEILTHVKEVGNVDDVEYKTSEEGLEDFVGGLDIDSEVFEVIEDNPLQDIMYVSLNDINLIDKTYNDILDSEYLSEEDVVYNAEGYDIVQNLNKGLIIFMVVMVVIIVTITIPIINILVKNSIDNRQQEIYIKRSIGASRWNILNPIILELFIMMAVSFIAYLGINYYLLVSLRSIINSLNIDVLQVGSLRELYLTGSVVSLGIGVVFVLFMVMYVSFRKVKI